MTHICACTLERTSCDPDLCSCPCHGHYPEDHDG